MINLPKSKPSLGWGFMWETQIAKCYANARVTTIYAGTNEIMKELIARKITRDA